MSLWDDLEKDASAPSKKQEESSSDLWGSLERVGTVKPNAPGLMSDVKRGVGNMISTTGTTLRDKTGDLIGEGMENYGQSIVDRNPSQINSWEDIKEHPFVTLREAVGENIPQIGSAVGGSLLGRAAGMGLGALTGPFAPVAVPALGTAGAFIGGALPIYAQEYGGIRQEQNREGINDPRAAELAALPATALEFLGPEGMIARKIAGKGITTASDRLGLQGLKRAGMELGIQGAKEGATEVGQTALERWGAHQQLTGDEALDDYAVSGIKGALGGGVAGAALSPFHGRPNPRVETDLLNTAPLGINQDEITGPPPPLVGPQLPAFVGPELPEIAGPAKPEGFTAPVDTAKALPEKNAVGDELDNLLIEIGVAPTKGLKALTAAGIDKGIDPREDTGFATALAQNYGAAKKYLQSTLAARNKPQGAPNVSNTVPVDAGTPASVGAGSPVIQGSLGNPGPVPPVQRGGSPDAGALGGASQSVPPVANAGGERPAPVAPAPVVPRVIKKDSVAPAQPAVTETPTSDQLEIARMTGNAAELEAQHQEDLGLRADNPLADDASRDSAVSEILGARFADSPTKDRDVEIAQAYLLARKEAPQGAKGTIVRAIAEQFGMSEANVKKLGNLTALKEAAAKLGYTPAQVEDLFESRDTSKSTKGKTQAEIQQVQDEGEAAEEASQLTTALKELGIETGEGETGGFGYDDNREWSKPEDAADALTNELLRGHENLQKLRGLKEKFAKTPAVVSKLEEEAKKLEKTVSEIEAKLKGELTDEAKKTSDKTKKALKGKSRTEYQLEEEDEPTGLDGKSATSANENKREALTDSERAGRAWDETASTIYGAPKWSELTEEQRDSFADYGEENWTPGDVVLELKKISDSKKAIPAQERRLLEKGVGRLSEGQKGRLASHYGAAPTSEAFWSKLRDDVTAYVTKGAEAVAGAIRDIVRAVANGVMAAAIVFNPGALNTNFAFSPERVTSSTSTYKTTVTVPDLAEVPAAAAAKMSDGAQKVYQAMAPAAKKTGKGFMIADKPAGMLHVFNADGSHFASEPALFGKDKGDVLKNGSRTTPAGSFKMEAINSDGEYASKKILYLPASMDSSGFIAVHPAWLGDPKENRLARLKSKDPNDRRISYGCVNTSHDLFINKIEPQIEDFNGGMIHIMPDAVEYTGAMFQPGTKGETTTETRTTFRSEPAKQSQERPSDKPGIPVGERQATRTASGTRRKANKSDVKPMQVEYATGKKGVRAILTRDGTVTLTETSFEKLSQGRHGAAWDFVRGKIELNEALSAMFERLGGVHMIDDKTLLAGILQVDGRPHLVVSPYLDEYLDGVPEQYRDGEIYWLLAHELGHVADRAHAQDGGIYSDVFRTSAAFREIKEFYARVMDDLDGASKFERNLAAKLQYPFNDRRTSQANQAVEAFAQLWAATNTKFGWTLINEQLPEVAKFFGAVYAHLNLAEGILDLHAKAGVSTKLFEAGARDEAPETTQGQLGVGAGPELRPIRAPGSVSEATALRAIGGLPKPLQPSARNTFTTLRRWGRKGVDRIVFTADLLDRAVKTGLNSAKKFQRLLQERDAMARAHEVRVEKILDLYNKVPEAERGKGPNSVNDFLKDSTRDGLWGFQPSWLSKPVKLDSALAARFDKLSPASQEFIKSVFKHGDDMLNLKQRTVLDYTRSEFDAEIAKARTAGDKEQIKELEEEKQASLTKFQTLFKLHIGRPYAPMKRFGKYVTVAKSKTYLEAEKGKKYSELAKLRTDPKHYQVDFPETEEEANAIEREHEAAGFEAFYTKERELADDTDMLGAVTRLRHKFNSSIETEDEEDTESGRSKAVGTVRHIINQLYLQALAESSARKSELRREGVEGRIDMVRSFASQGRSDAQFLASVKYAFPTLDAIRDMRKEVDRGNTLRKSELFNEIMARYQQTLEYHPSTGAQVLNRMASVWYLATSPAYYLQNLTQPYMLSLPVMAGRHDWTRSAGEIVKAAQEVANIFGTTDRSVDVNKLPADVRTVIEELLNRGLVDIGISSEMGSWKVQSDGKLAKGWNAVDKSMKVAVQKVETFNRLATAVAAYRMEMAKTGNRDGATEYAATILRDTHGDYTSFNAPRAFNTSLGKVMLQFRKFQLIQLTLLAKLMRDSLNGPNKAEARRALAFTLGHTAVMTGAMGLPGAAAISWMLSKLLGDEDEPWDAEVALRRAIGDEDIANLITRGAPAMLGLDLSGKLGMGTALSVLPFADADLTSRTGAAATLGTLVGGPVGSIGFRMADGIGLMNNGQYYKGVEQMLPKGIADAMKAYRIGTEGVTRRNGDVVMSADEINFAESLLQGIGFTPMDQQVRSIKQNAVYDYTTKFTDRAKQIKQQYADAAKGKDPASMAAAREAWKKLQEARKKNGFASQPLSDLLKAPQEQRQREKKTSGGVEFSKQNRKFVESLV